MDNMNAGFGMTEECGSVFFNETIINFSICNKSED